MALRCGGKMRALLLVSLFLTTKAALAAPLVGSNVHLMHYYDGGNYGEANTVVGDGIADAVDMFAGYYFGDPRWPVGYHVNLDEAKISVRFYHPYSTYWSGGTFNGLLVTSDALDLSSILSSLTITTDHFSLGSERVTAYGPQTLGLNFQGLTFSSLSSFELTWTPATVPEAPLLPLMAIAVTLMLAERGAKRKKQVRAEGNLD